MHFINQQLLKRKLNEVVYRQMWNVGYERKYLNNVMRSDIQ